MLVELVVQPNCKLLRQKNMFKLQASKTVPKPKNINQLIRDLDFWDCFKGGWGGGDLHLICGKNWYIFQGGDLDALINDSKKSNRRFDEKFVMDLFVQLLLAVHYMHTRRVLHRDLKTRWVSVE